MKKFETYYINTLWDKLDEHVLHYDTDFKENLNKLRSLYPQNDIVKDLLSLMNSDNKEINANFINTDFVDDTKLSFVEDKKIDKLFKDELAKYKHLSDEEKEKQFKDLHKNDWMRIARKEQVPRKSIKIGRLAQRLMTLKDKHYTASEIEKFVNMFIAINRDKNDAFTFQILEGHRIYEAYDRDNYQQEEGHDNNDEYRGGGDDDDGGYETVLHQSCMVNKDDRFPGILKLYEENPEQINILTLSENNEIVARAILWKNVEMEFENSGGTEMVTYLDRIYYMNDFQMEKMRAYAIKNEWAYRAANSYDRKNNIIYKGATKNVVLKVKLDKAKFQRYPYMDTFTYLDIKSKIISNQTVFESYIEMIGTDGEYRSHEFVIDCKGARRMKNTCHFSKGMQVWIHSGDRDIVSYRAIDVKLANDYALRTWDKLIETPFGYCIKDDCIHSNHCDDYYFKFDVIRVGDDYIPINGNCCSGQRIKDILTEFLITIGGYEVDELQKLRNNKELLILYRRIIDVKGLSDKFYILE